MSTPASRAGGRADAPLRVPPRLRPLLLGFGCAAALLHTANLGYLARIQGCAPVALSCAEPALWTTRDSLSYLRISRVIERRGLLAAPTLKRPTGYPLLLTLARRASGSAEAARWLGPLLAGGAAAAVVWLAALLGRGRATGLLAGVLFCLWLPLYQFSPLLLTDAVHAFAAVAALAATACWTRQRRRAAWWAAALLWPATQALRPTFVFLPLLLPILLVRRRPSRRYLRGCAALWLASCAVPVALVGANLHRHGVAAPTRLFADALACYAVPRLGSQLGGGGFVELRARCLERYRGLPAATRMRQQTGDGWRALRARPAAALRSHLDEIQRQLLYPARPFYARAALGAYPAWAMLPGPVLAVFWLCGLAGLWSLRRAAPEWGLFLLAVAAAVLVPASFSHAVGARLRLPLDLLLMPVVAAFLAGAAAAFGRRIRALRTSAPADAAHSR